MEINVENIAKFRPANFVEKGSNKKKTIKKTDDNPKEKIAS
ncbi:hypothetical protein ACL9RF_00625 [Sphingobacterium sp. Mn56C]